MTIVFDAGGLIALERGDLQIHDLLTRERSADRMAVTHGGVLGQVWRGGAGRQALLARSLPGVDVVPLDDELGRRAGILLGLTRTADVVDAALVLLAEDGDVVLTSDVADLRRLADAVNLHVDLVPV